MTGLADVRTDLRRLLDAVQAAAPVQAVDVLARELARMVAADDVSFLIADFSGDALIRLPGSARPGGTGTPPGRAASVQLSGSPHERAIRCQEVVVERRPEGARILAPVTERGDALGVLELTVPQAPDEDMVTFLASAAHALAYVVIANRRHTDLFERSQREVPFSLAAEIQRRLLPAAFTCEASEATIAGWLEPASNVGGDTFDYSLEHDVLHLSISDAMGHTVNAAQLATLAVSSLRNSRRSHAGLVEQAHAADDAISDNTAETGFVTALMLRVELATGVVAVVNAGHPAPYLVSHGEVSMLNFDADPPLGIMPGTAYHEQRLVLGPGDRLVLVTDGMLERNATSLDIAAALHDMAHLHPREVVHAFARQVLGATGGQLRDDATVLVVDWYGRDGGGDRVARAGATQSLASGVEGATG